MSDDTARARAIDPQRSVLLQAPAGSGKTTVLIRRFLSALLTVDEVEEVIAITFTRKAAAEMRDRVMHALMDAQTDLARRVLERSVVRGWNLQESPARLRIQTIDSLNRWLASRLPLGSGGAGELSIADDTEALYALAARRCVVDAERSASLGDELDLIYARLDNDRAGLEQLIAAMLQKRSHWLPRVLGADSTADLHSRVNASLTALLQDAFEAARQVIPAELIAQGARIAIVACRCHIEQNHVDDGIWSSWGSEPDGALGHVHWRALCALAFTKELQWRRQLTIREGIEPKNKAFKADALQWIADLQAIERAQDVLRDLAELPEVPLSAEDADVLGALTRLLTLAASELEVVFREMQRVDFTYLAGAARQSLIAEGEPTDLALRLGDAIRHILVDEFQDTSIDQFTLLEQLTATWEPGDGRTLFVVGDPMQSIYLFRDAEVGLFLRARERGIGTVKLEPLYLERNFRAAPAVVDWTNEAFAQLFPANEDQKAGAVKFLSSIAQLQPVPGSGVTVHRVADDPAIEAEAIATCIAGIRAREPYATIAVLVLAKAHAGPIVRALDARQIPSEAVDLITLREVSVVRDLGALARAIDHLADRTAWLGILRAPWCGLTLVDLTELLGDAPRDATVWDILKDGMRVASVTPDARARLDRFVAAMSPVISGDAGAALAERVEVAWLRLGGPSCVRAADLAAAEVFFVALGQWTRAPEWGGPLTLDARLAQLYAPQSSLQGAVQFMTIHRAKGLEFDKVIVPSLHRGGRQDREPLLRWVELPRADGEPDLLIAPRPDVTDRSVDRLNQYLKRLVALRRSHERVRLMYVAATRAKTELHWFAALEDGKNPVASSFLGCLWPAIQIDFLQQPMPVATSVQDNLAPPVYFRLKPGSRHADLPDDVVWQGIAVASYEPRTLHRDATDEIVRQSLLKGVVDPGRAELSRLLLWRGVAANAVSTEIDIVQMLLATTDAHPLVGPWLFDARLKRETLLTLTGLYEGRLTNVCIDVRVEDAQGVQWLIRLAGGIPQSGDDLLHQRELDKWRLLARAAWGIPFRGAIYYPRTQALLLT